VVFIKQKIKLRNSPPKPASGHRHNRAPKEENSEIPHRTQFCRLSKSPLRIELRSGRKLRVVEEKTRKGERKSATQVSSGGRNCTYGT